MCSVRIISRYIHQLFRSTQSLSLSVWLNPSPTSNWLKFADGRNILIICTYLQSVCVKSQETWVFRGPLRYRLEIWKDWCFRVQRSKNCSTVGRFLIIILICEYKMYSLFMNFWLRGTSSFFRWKTVPISWGFYSMLKAKNIRPQQKQNII